MALQENVGPVDLLDPPAEMEIPDLVVISDRLVGPDRPEQLVHLDQLDPGETQDLLVALEPQVR